QLGPNINVTVNPVGTNATSDQLKTNFNTSIATQLVTAGVTLGFAGLTTGSVASGSHADAGSAPFTAAGLAGIPPWDIPFSIVHGSDPVIKGTVTRGAAIAF